MEFADFGYLGLFVSAFLAGTPVPMNCEVVLSALLMMGYGLVPCIASAVVGNWCGATVNYLIGRLCNYEKMLRLTRVKPERLEKVRDYLMGRGTWCAMGSFIPLLGNALIIYYGILRAPFWKVGCWMLVGQIVRFTVWSYITIYTVVD